MEAREVVLAVGTAVDTCEADGEEERDERRNEGANAEEDDEEGEAAAVVAKERETDVAGGSEGDGAVVVEGTVVVAIALNDVVDKVDEAESEVVGVGG